jgi:SCY1-like protein 3
MYIEYIFLLIFLYRYLFILVNNILQLLVGIKDTDDNLVASTLICLSNLVPILGAGTVVGGKRSKLFTDGRPNSKTALDKAHDCNIYSPSKPLGDLPCSEEIFRHNAIISSGYEKSMTLNERPSPVGGESIENEIIPTNDALKPDSEDDWSDWENTNRQLTFAETIEYPRNTNIINQQQCDDDEPNINLKLTDIAHEPINNVNKTSLLQKAAIEAKKNIVDISELDIKNQKTENSKKGTDEFDFFADMIPIIEKPTIVNVAQTAHQESFSSKLDFVHDDTLDDNPGWGDNWEE